MISYLSTASLVLLVAAPMNCGGTGREAATGAAAAVTRGETALLHLFASAHSAWPAPAETVFRDRSSWAEAWGLLHGGEMAATTAPPLAEIDFTKQMVIIVALGQRNTGGYTVQITEVVAEGSGALVRYSVGQPGADCMTTQALTSPVDVVAIPRMTGVVRFERRTTVVKC